MTKKITGIILVGILITMCGSLSDEDIFNQAKKNLGERNFVEASSNFVKLLNEFPDSKFSFDANYELGKMYHGQAIKDIDKNESMKKAIEYYKSAFQIEPTRKEAANALFMAGFIEANDLKDLDAAREIYNTFIEEYPDNELTSSAKAELANLGKSAEEILAGKIEQAK